METVTAGHRPNTNDVETGGVTGAGSWSSMAALVSVYCFILAPEGQLFYHVIICALHDAYSFRLCFPRLSFFLTIIIPFAPNTPLPS